MLILALLANQAVFCCAHSHDDSDGHSHSGNAHFHLSISHHDSVDQPHGHQPHDHQPHGPSDQSSDDADQVDLDTRLTLGTLTLGTLTLGTLTLGTLTLGTLTLGTLTLGMNSGSSADHDFGSIYFGLQENLQLQTARPNFTGTRLTGPAILLACIDWSVKPVATSLAVSGTQSSDVGSFVPYHCAIYLQNRSLRI